MPDTKSLSCPAEKAAMLCMLAADHEGLHYDSIDDISWIAGNAHEMKIHHEGTSYCTRQPEHEGDARCLS
jgi:hypothetical protein